MPLARSRSADAKTSSTSKQRCVPPTSDTRLGRAVLSSPLYSKSSTLGPSPQRRKIRSRIRVSGPCAELALHEGLIDMERAGPEHRHCTEDGLKEGDALFDIRHGDPDVSKCVMPFCRPTTNPSRARIGSTIWVTHFVS